MAEQHVFVSGMKSDAVVFQPDRQRQTLMVRRENQQP
jgi:hypothetical protein